MQRAPVLVCAVLATALLGAGSALAASARTDSRLQANRAIARSDTRALLSQLKLPSGTAHAGSQLPLPALVPPKITGVNTLGASAEWTTAASPDAVITYVKAHRPRAPGYAQSGSEPPSTLTFGWTIDGPHLYSQQLQVTVATLADGRTGIMAQAQSKWMVPRPLSEVVPAGVRSLAVMLRVGSGVGGLKHQRTQTYRFTNAATVSSIVNAANALPITQPGLIYMCPADFPGEPFLSIRFLSASGSTLARARVNVYPGKNGGSGWIGCDPIDFWIGRAQQTPLTSHTFVKRIAKLIGADVS